MLAKSRLFVWNAKLSCPHVYRRKNLKEFLSLQDYKLTQYGLYLLVELVSNVNSLKGEIFIYKARELAQLKACAGVPTTPVYIRPSVVLLSSQCLVLNFSLTH